MSYDDRIKILKERKLEETRVKSTMKVYQDGDDYGSIPAPETYQFHCIPNHENGSWYGYDGWSKNFYKLMTEHPVYIDPVDAFTCRWMFSMIWFDEKSPDKGLNWNPNFPYDDLKPEQELYGIISGIGSDAHFGGKRSAHDRKRAINSILPLLGVSKWKRLRSASWAPPVMRARRFAA